MNIHFLPQDLRKQTAFAKIVAHPKWIEIINQHTLFKIRAYAETGQNKKIARLCISCSITTLTN
ncbi:hypothetical protein AY608_10545 [Acinetobacter terrae]|jgi:hypothetical protein|nr:hypothetical protein AY608_10545 [Acinetobacter terrae]OTG77890.1 hypothetical protein B9T23_05280 [Acinetobacter terrae]